MSRSSNIVVLGSAPPRPGGERTSGYPRRPRRSANSIEGSRASLYHHYATTFTPTRIKSPLRLHAPVQYFFQCLEDDSVCFASVLRAENILHQALEALYLFFTQRTDCAGKAGPTALQKGTAAMHILAYDTAADF